METVFETRTKIVGVTRGNRQDLLEELSEMDDIRLVREPNNLMTKTQSPYLIRMERSLDISGLDWLKNWCPI